MQILPCDQKRPRFRLHTEPGASCKQAPAETSECLLCELVEICILILSVLRISGQRKLDAIRKNGQILSETRCKKRTFCGIRLMAAMISNNHSTMLLKASPRSAKRSCRISS